ncbi:zinc finger BED domain-containing protein RICESLEEPER 2-like [Cornus florida]|uniref:zinc finger BED domain-containing protein RICESLEEPER 2-like n=1 Tax=Cornus florida TaxID=4283 RepID=UPI00289DDDBC|nr:zinc finger BED domain-containing protein RICESLEEPER 2-like [Cornus florida]XP_059643342.1 zinc finger BED domain-containing protein RICESLEEPER 2-like [Cornus florida]XP_059643343.1 zinc finger BED domain-containing protein RICESLEEPER 2-like [Cornus florida]
MASKMMDKILKYWNVCHVVMAVAVVLDPRYKMKLVEYHFGEIYGDEASSEIQKVRQNVYDLFCAYQVNTMTDGNMDVDVASTSSQATNLSEDASLSKFDRYLNSSVTNFHTRTELEFYLEESVLPRTPNFNVLTWWGSNGVKFPTLQKIARDILAIPVSTVVSESTFSTGGRMVSPHRSRLHPSTLMALMCAQNWLLCEDMDGTDSIFDPCKLSIYSDNYNDDNECVPEVCQD